jgi:7-keto-8-aminopelargonate synthetase-like enzyme
VKGGGRGTLAHFGVISERIVYMGTLGKAAGVAGAFVAAHPAVIEMLVQTARPYIFTTAAPAMLACALEESLAIIRSEPERRERLAALIGRWRGGAAGRAKRWLRCAAACSRAARLRARRCARRWRSSSAPTCAQ